MVPRLQPGKLAQLIAALYTGREQRVNGVLGPALQAAAAVTGLDVIYSSDQVQQQDNEYNITAAMLAPKLAARGGIGPSQAASCLRSSHPSSPADAQQTRPARTELQQAVFSQPVLAAAGQTAVTQHCGIYHPRLFPVYLIIAGIDRGLECHMRANMQILSQADFFWGVDRLWTWVGQQLGHYQTVPDVLLKLQSGMLLPWLRQFHGQYMPQLSELGYSGLQVVMSGHSLGAAIVDTAALMMPHSCSDIPVTFTSISFESPGVPQAVLKQFGDDTAIPDRMVSYLGNPSPVNSLCKHPGRVYHVYAEPPKPGLSDVALYAGLDLARCLALTQVTAAAAGLPLDMLSLTAAGALGATASLVDKTVLAWQDLVLHHSLAGITLGFDPETGEALPVPGAVQQMADWPLFSPSIGSKLPLFVLRDLLLGTCLPSVLYSRNRGVQMLLEGKRARHMRLVRRLRGFEPFNG